MLLLFLEDWRSYRAGGTYEVDDAVAELITRRGFAVRAPAKPTKKRKTANGSATAPRKRKRPASN